MHISNKKFLIGICSFFLGVIIILFIVAIQAPSNFPAKQIDITVKNNSSITSTSNHLYSKKIIQSTFLFKALIVIMGGSKGIHAGDYRFTESQNLVTVAYRLVNGVQGLPKIKITIPEGTNVSDMAYILMTKLPYFNAPKFYQLAKSEEGYLFPDTYFFLSNTKPEEVINEMKANFNAKISGLKTEIEKSGRSLRDIIIMASIIEEEARSLEEKKMVSGILWSRLKNGMLLQVDPPFYYITGKTGIVTYDDLKIDSPYNTYKYAGLPKGPISNPGLDSIKAALNPTKSDYLFYLTGKDGVMRYAKTYDGHLKNKALYLD